MAAAVSAKLPDPTIGRIEGHPQRIFVIDVIGDPKNYGAAGKAGGGHYISAEILTRHDAIDCRDHHWRTGQAVGNELKAGVGRGGRAHDQIEIQIAAVSSKPSSAIVTLAVDEDCQSADAHSTKAIEGMLYEGASGYSHHWLAVAIAICAQAAAGAGRDDAALLDRICGCMGHSKIFARSPSRATTG